MEEGDPGRRLDGTAAFRLWLVAGVPHLEIDLESPVPGLCLLCFIRMIDAMCVCVRARSRVRVLFPCVHPVPLEISRGSGEALSSPPTFLIPT